MERHARLDGLVDAHFDDVDDALEPLEIRGITGVERQAMCTRGRGDQEIEGSPTAWLATAGKHCGENAAVGARRTMTDVSTKARWWSTTWRNILVDEAVDIAAETLQVDRCSPGKGCLEPRLRDEAPTIYGANLPNWYSVAGHDKALACVECAHDRAALIPEFALRDRMLHGRIVAQLLRHAEPSEPATARLRVPLDGGLVVITRACYSRAMGTLNIRLDADVKRFIARVASRSNRTRSEVAREALTRYRAEEEAHMRAATRPVELIKHLIGAFPGNESNLSVDSGAKFKAKLRAKAQRGLGQFTLLGHE